MKSIREIKALLVGCFYGVVFIAQMIGWTIINYMGGFETSIWCITGTAVLLTVITCSVYLLLRKLYQRFRRCEDDVSMEEYIYEILGTD